MITKEYIEGLQRRITQLQADAAELFDIGNGEGNVSTQRSNAEIAFYADIMGLKGYVEVLNPGSFPSQTFH
jgi:hypothetical protein